MILRITKKKSSLYPLFSSFILIIMLIMCSSAMSQSVQSTNSSSKVPEPDLKVRPTPQALPQDEESVNLSFLPSVFIRKFNLVGNTVFSTEELSMITSRYKNRDISFEELQSLRREITHYYVNKGYINSGALIPDQPVINGIITINIIEGVLSKIQIEGNKYFQDHFLADRLALAAGPPVNISKIRETLLQLQQDPRIKQINAELKSGLMLGESILHVYVEEDKPFQVGMEVGNHQSPSVGAIRGELQLGHRNLTGKGDSLEGIFGFTEGLHDLNIMYAFPVNARDTSIKLQYKRSESTVIEDIFASLDIESVSETYGIAVSWPSYKNSGQKLTFSLAGEHRLSEVYSHDQPLPYAYGVEDGKAKVTVIRFSQEWVDRNHLRIIAARSCFNVGIDALGATINDSGVDGQFFTWLGQFQWKRRTRFLDTQIVFRTNIQLARDPLLPLEKFAVGGMDSVRGYRENQLIGDKGIVSSLELRFPIIRYRHGTGLVQLAPFYDFGNSENKSIDKLKEKGIISSRSQSISSVGIGLRWTIIEKIHFQIYTGHALKNIDIDSKGDSLQDKGIHFRLTGQIW